MSHLPSGPRHRDERGVRPTSSPEGRIRAAFPCVQQYLDGLIDRFYGVRHPMLDASMRTLVARGRRDPQEFALPLLVHAAVRGSTEPAVPVAAVHALWWRAANALDDAVDGGGDDGDAGAGAGAGPRSYGMAGSAALTATLECGYGLPLRVLATLPVPEALRRALTADYLDGWTAACDGQLGDLLNEPDAVGPDEVREVYRKKSGAVYAMACVLAARLAHGAGAAVPGPRADEVAAWGEFGEVLGILAQLRNDHEDLHGGTGEDLRNGTATYRLAQLLHRTDRAAGDRARLLLGRAADSEPHHRELTELLGSPEVLRPCNRLLAELRHRAHALLDVLSPASPYTALLRARVDAEARPLDPR
ncbi:polyprenyl synthetase family protein, partial [Streptomyces phytophilus]|uniref:polyprenyl synthetase family protein n=1 Tax=Streptomyces phytophilus TaxID=722715 RepID=UPI0015F03286